jgi:hypothetical protein
MPPPTTSQALIDEARAALERLAAGSPAGQVAYAAIDELDRAWPVSPLSVGLTGGDPDARFAALAALAAGALAGVTRTERSPPLRLHRGAIDGFVIVRDGGGAERAMRPARRPTADDAGVRAATASAEVARVASEQHARAARAAAEALPAVIRTRPPWWAVWAWIARWIAGVFRRGAVAARRDAEAAAAESARAADRAVLAIDDARAAARAPNERYAARLAAACADGDGIRYVDVEVAGGALPDDVVVIELATRTDALELDVELDRVVAVRAGALFVEDELDPPRHLGQAAGAAAALGTLALTGRAVRLTRRAIAAIGEAARSLDEMLDGSEADHRRRLEPLRARRLADPDAFVAAQLERVAPQINASIGAIMEHALTHVGAELTELATTWADAIGAATGRDELKDAIARVDREWPAATARAGDEARLLIQGGLGGSAHDLHADAVAPLAAYGLGPDQLRAPRAAPVLPALELLPSLDGASEAQLDTTSWLGALFRSFDTRRAEVLARLTARIDKIREVVRAEMLDAEPRLYAVLADAARDALGGAITAQRAWLEAALAREQEQIERDRLALGPLLAARDAAREDARRLTALAAAAERGE